MREVLARLPERGRGRGRPLRGPRRQVHGRRRAGLLRLAPGARGRRRARRAGRPRARRRRSAGLATPAGAPLAARVGIATGLVVVGDLVGEGAAREEAVVGETPNLAARLQALAEPGAVVVADGTRRLLGGLFELRRPRRAARSRASPTRCAASGSRASAPPRAASRPARPAALTPMVGRDAGAGAAARPLAAGRGRRGPGGAAGRRGRDRQVAPGRGPCASGSRASGTPRCATSARRYHTGHARSGR